MNAPEFGRRGAGLAFGVAAYTLWGVLPAYFLLFAPATPFEVVSFRILMSLIFCVLLITVTRGWPRFIALVRQPRVLGTMALAGVFIYANWQIYVIAVLDGRVVEGSLGYFINPLVTVLLGVVVLREKLRPAQWVAVGLSGVAILVIAIGYGQFPWISLGLAFSFGFYGFIKKRVGNQVDAVSGLALETLLLSPVAAIQLLVVGATVGLTIGQHGWLQTAALIGAGAVTAIPLLLFAAAARRLPLVWLGLTQYLAPVLQLLFGVVVLHEAMTTGRWVGFAIVWVALLVLTVDVLVAGRAQRRASLEPI